MVIKALKGGAVPEPRAEVKPARRPQFLGRARPDRTQRARNVRCTGQRTSRQRTGSVKQKWQRETDVMA
jgi:hypothetical protein